MINVSQSRKRELEAAFDVFYEILKTFKVYAQVIESQLGFWEARNTNLKDFLRQDIPLRMEAALRGQRLEDTNVILQWSYIGGYLTNFLRALRAEGITCLHRGALMQMSISKLVTYLNKHKHDELHDPFKFPFKRFP